LAETVPYSDRYEPPAPVLRTLISVPEGGTGSPAAEVVALCDTGADITALPLNIVVTLGFAEVDEIEIAPYEGEPTTKRVYTAVLHLPGSNPQLSRVVPFDGEEAILGRDLLNSVRIELDGPSKTLRLL
jgi:predicted aspartyl protease